MLPARVRVAAPVLTRAKLFSLGPVPPRMPPKLLLAARFKVRLTAEALPLTMRLAAPLPALVSPASVWEKPLSLRLPLASVEPSPRVSAVAVGYALSTPRMMAPFLMVVVAVKLLALARVKAPLPVFTSAPLPEMTPD